MLPKLFDDSLFTKLVVKRCKVLLPVLSLTKNKGCVSFV